MKSEHLKYLAVGLIVGMAVGWAVRYVATADTARVGRYQVASTGTAFVVIDTVTGAVESQESAPATGTTAARPPQPMMIPVDMQTVTGPQYGPVRVDVSGVDFPSFPSAIDVHVSGTLGLY